ncbi:hypothetical protein [Kocuria aegyptia]|uniref:DUF2568 domain-containing protein n=1 Tax=Kocuria aegyptia TaxID=330943 RepID=A0ABP4W4W2_9MICC
MGDNAIIETIFGLIFLISHLIGPALIIAMFVVAAPLVRRRQPPVSRERRIAALLMAILCLLWAFQLIGWFQGLGVYGVVLMVGLIGSAVLVLAAERLNHRPLSGTGD